MWLIFTKAFNQQAQFRHPLYFKKPFWNQVQMLFAFCKSFIMQVCKTSQNLWLWKIFFERLNWNIVLLFATRRLKIPKQYANSNLAISICAPMCWHRRCACKSSKMLATFLEISKCSSYPSISKRSGYFLQFCFLKSLKGALGCRTEYTFSKHFWRHFFSVARNNMSIYSSCHKPNAHYLNGKKVVSYSKPVLLN